MSVDAIDRQHMISIADGFKIHQQRRMPQKAERHRREHRTLHAMRDTFAQHRSRRIAGIAARLQVVADFRVEKSLDGRRGLQAAEDLPFRRFEIMKHARQITALLLYSRMLYA